MANCVKCKKPVGCGCQLLNGLCTSCRGPVTNPVPPKPVNDVNNSTPNNQ